MYQNAIVRIPGKNFSQGLTTQNLGAPNFKKALKQHNLYTEALIHCGLGIISLPEDLDNPDSTFVEDTAVLVNELAILTRPGAESRQGEVQKIKEVLVNHFNLTSTIVAPGTLDGGDVCEAENHFFIGISERTNLRGAIQFQEMVKPLGYSVDFVDIRAMPEILHLKSGLSYLGDKKLVVIDCLEQLPVFEKYHRILVDSNENYAANCLRVNDRILIPKGFPNIADKLSVLGFTLVLLNVSEFQKMDGGLSCLSLRF